MGWASEFQSWFPAPRAQLGYDGSPLFWSPILSWNDVTLCVVFAAFLFALRELLTFLM